MTPAPASRPETAVEAADPDPGPLDDQLLDDGQEEVFAREELLSGRVEHHAGEESAPTAPGRSIPQTTSET